MNKHHIICHHVIYIRWFLNTQAEIIHLGSATDLDIIIITIIILIHLYANAKWFVLC